MRSFKWVLAIVLLWMSGVSARSQEIPAFPKRVISLSPNITEIIYDMGAQDLLIADTVFCKFPPGARTKEKVGGWENINFEKIVSLKPDLVLALKFYGKNEETFKKLHIPTVVLQGSTIQDVLDSYNVIGEKLGRLEAAKKARAKLEKELNRIQKKAHGDKPLSVLFVIGHGQGNLQQIYGVGPNNFIDELVAWAGGVNVLKDSPIPYPIVSKERLLRQDPDVIIDALPKSEVKPGQFEEDQQVWKQFPALKAVRNGNVYCFNNEDFTVPGPTMLHLAQYLFGIFNKVRANP